ncbi:MAG: hypothetical protein WBP16_12705 [Ferruginibacter sp.]
MRKTSLLVLFLIFTSSCFSQSEMKVIDSILNYTAPRRKSSLKKVIVGNKRTGTAYFFLKSNNTVYSIVDRTSFYSSGKKRDSTYEIKYFFLEEKLVKVIYYRSTERPNSKGFAYYYFKDGNLIGNKNFADHPKIAIEIILKESAIQLEKASELIDVR